MSTQHNPKSSTTALSAVVALPKSDSPSVRVCQDRISNANANSKAPAIAIEDFIAAVLPDAFKAAKKLDKEKPILPTQSLAKAFDLEDERKDLVSKAENDGPEAMELLISQVRLQFLMEQGRMQEVKTGVDQQIQLAIDQFESLSLTPIPRVEKAQKEERTLPSHERIRLTQLDLQRDAREFQMLVKLALRQARAILMDWHSTAQQLGGSPAPLDIEQAVGTVFKTLTEIQTIVAEAHGRHVQKRIQGSLIISNNRYHAKLLRLREENRLLKQRVKDLQTELNKQGGVLLGDLQAANPKNHRFSAADIAAEVGLSLSQVRKSLKEFESIRQLTANREHKRPSKSASPNGGQRVIDGEYRDKAIKLLRKKHPTAIQE